MGGTEEPNIPLCRLPDSWINRYKINVAEFQINHWKEMEIADAFLLLGMHLGFWV